MQKIITLGDFTLTSTWTVGNTPEGYKKTTPSTAKTTLTLDLSSLPTGAIVNSATLYVEREWGDTGAALDTINDSKWDTDHGGWKASEDITALVKANIGGAAYLTFKYKANGHANPPAGTKRSSLHYKLARVTIDYTPASSTGTLNKSSVQMNDTDTITLSISPTSSSATHKAKWSVGGQGLIEHAVNGTGDTLTVPDAWNNYCINSTSATAQVVLETYLNGTLTGSKAYSFTVIVPSNITPSLTPSISAIGAFEGHNLKGKTQAKITPNAKGVLGSTIRSISFSGAGQTGSTPGGAWTSNPISSTGTYVFTVTATDSRGRTASKTINFKVEDYSLPYIQMLACYRTDANGKPDTLGTKGFFKVKYGVHVVGNNVVLAVTARLFDSDGTKLYDSSHWAKGAAEKTDSTSFGLTLDITKKYRIEFAVTDSVGSTSTITSFIEQGGHSLFDFQPDRAGIGMWADKPKTLSLPSDWTIEGGGVTKAVEDAALLATEAKQLANSLKSDMGGFLLQKSDGVAFVHGDKWHRLSAKYEVGREYLSPYTYKDTPVFFKNVTAVCSGNGQTDINISGGSGSIVQVWGHALYNGQRRQLPYIVKANDKANIYMYANQGHVYIQLYDNSWGTSLAVELCVWYTKV